MTDDLQIRLLGQLALSRSDAAIALPSSRKVRALLAYLTLNEGVARSTLCDLLWEVPNDPRGELRWCLSKLRGALDVSDRRYIESVNDRITLKLDGVFVDALELDRILKPGVSQLGVDSLRKGAELFGGEFLEGLQIGGSARFNAWLLAQRHRFKAAQLAVIERLSDLVERGSEEHFLRLQSWLQLAPFDRRVHESYMLVLAECGRVPDAETHLAATIRQFESEGIEWLPLREAWRAMRAQYDGGATKVVRVALQKESIPSSVATGEQSAPLIQHSSRRASVAVMPFIDKMTATHGGAADGLAEDIITRLAKLRAFFVIARGTAFALRERNIGPQEAGRILNVDYVISGYVTRQPGRMSVAVELVNTRTGRLHWADEFDCSLVEACAAIDNLGDRIVGAVTEEIENSERNLAILKAPNSLDAWESYHRGLWHMYRFSSDDNAQAEQLFRTAVRLDPTFARAHAGLSFAHFQNAFLHRPAEHDLQTELALQTAGQSLMADDRDPAAHWAMGRALWLRGNQDESLRELTRSVELSPNFSLGHYTLGFVLSQSGDPKAAIEATECSRNLSPFDPMQFAMLATNAMAHIRLGNYEEASSWALKAIARPNAHTHILAIAAHCLAAANRLNESRAIAAMIRRDEPRYSMDHFLTSFRFDKDTVDLFRRNTQRIGF